MSATAPHVGSGHSHESWHLHQLPTAGTALPIWLIQVQEEPDYLGKNCMTLPTLSLTFLRGGEVLRVRHGGLQLAARPWEERQTREVEG